MSWSLIIYSKLHICTFSSPKNADSLRGVVSVAGLETSNHWTSVGSHPASLITKSLSSFIPSPWMLLYQYNLTIRWKGRKYPFIHSFSKKFIVGTHQNVAVFPKLGEAHKDTF